MYVQYEKKARTDVVVAAAADGKAAMAMVVPVTAALAALTRSNPPEPVEVRRLDCAPPYVVTTATLPFATAVAPTWSQR